MSPQFVDWWLSHPSLFGMPFHFWTVFIVILGAFVGSFLNVCIHRMPLDQSVVNPPSHCPHCRYSIPWYLNIPVITWLWLRGRCRSCAAPISPRYLAVEVLTAALFALCWVHFGHNDPGLALALCVLFSLFVVATFIDFEHFIIPDAITLGGAGAGLILSPIVPGLHATFSAGESLKRSALGIAIGFGVVYGVVRLGKLLFGRERIPLEPGTRVVFHEDGIVLPDRTIPFADSPEEREVTGDPRPAVAERYPDRDAYVAAITAAASALCRERLLLAEDVPRAEAAAANWHAPRHDVKLP